MSKASIQYGSVSLSAEGEDNFVNQFFSDWQHLLAEAPPLAAGESKDAKALAGSKGDPVQTYENVYDRVDGKLKLIGHISGSNKAEKTRNTALAVLYGHYLDGSEQIPSEIIRDACTDQGCYDSTNFASYLKALKEKIAMNTKSGGGYDVKLTAPGRKAAQEFVEALNG